MCFCRTLFLFDSIVWRWGESIPCLEISFRLFLCLKNLSMFKIHFFLKKNTFLCLLPSLSSLLLFFFCGGWGWDCNCVGCMMDCKTRIDYGTGHEAQFVSLLCALYRIGVFTVEDRLSIVFIVFTRYDIFRLILLLLFLFSNVLWFVFPVIASKWGDSSMEKKGMYSLLCSFFSKFLLLIFFCGGITYLSVKNIENKGTWS